MHPQHCWETGGGTEEEELFENANSVSKATAPKSSHVTLTVRTAKVDALQLIQQQTPAPTTKTTVRRRRLRKQPLREELAVQFEMDIQFQGKECTVVRSLYRMRQLREELVEENYEHLPALPTLSGCNNNDSKLNLTVLQASLFSYVPALEEWLRSIFRIVSMGESPTLTHFVLEPLCFLHTVSAEVFLDWNRTRKQQVLLSSSCSSLESIAEHADE